LYRQTVWITVPVVPPTTPLQRLATLALGEDVIAWVVSRRAADPQPSFRSIAIELRERTNGEVDLTDQTLANWHAEALAVEPQDVA
jgi:hypothetical protein